MPDTFFSNQAIINGIYASIPTSVASELVTVQLVDIVVTKSADPVIWTGGELTFTVTVVNNASEAFTDLVLTDVLDPTVAILVDDSVLVNGIPSAYTYDPVTGLLTVALPNVAPGGSAVITFQVVQV